jgi:hypothetical protein
MHRARVKLSMDRRPHYRPKILPLWSDPNVAIQTDIDRYGSFVNLTP